MLKLASLLYASSASPLVPGASFGGYLQLRVCDSVIKLKFISLERDPAQTAVTTAHREQGRGGVSVGEGSCLSRKRWVVVTLGDNFQRTQIMRAGDAIDMIMDGYICVPVCAPVVSDDVIDRCSCSCPSCSVRLMKSIKLFIWLVSHLHID